LILFFLLYLYNELLNFKGELLMHSFRHDLYIYERSHIYEEDKHRCLIKFYEKELKQKKLNLKEIMNRFKEGKWERDSKKYLIEQMKREKISILKLEQRFEDIKRDFKAKKKVSYID